MLCILYNEGIELRPEKNKQMRTNEFYLYHSLEIFIDNLVHTYHIMVFLELFHMYIIHARGILVEFST